VWPSGHGSDLLTIQVINFAVKLGLVREQFVLWHDRYFLAVELDAGGRSEINRLMISA
jgi:hypothetical protein